MLSHTFFLCLECWEEMCCNVYFAIPEFGESHSKAYSRCLHFWQRRGEKIVSVAHSLLFVFFICMDKLKEKFKKAIARGSLKGLSMLPDNLPNF